MSYTVLARKWRPKNFSELVGQSHVMQALSNALDQNRLHHAYLFTGTRGVGKTTIARIFAKALNCQHGVSSTPCGVCDNCRAIDEGRFIDLIEVDAASRTKVDDTREILDNVQFAPTQGRYKVYLIDEVHMLSKSSFNALLKTLEEPPEHVKFLLATTDPHKLPITVLSRCLQFNLMRLTQLQIQTHLEHILQQENLPYDPAALALIAKSADGSARDSLSLLDQAIAYGGGNIEFEAVQTMLGLVDQQYTVAILQALAEESPQAIKEVIQQLALMGVDYSALLSQLIETLHALAFNQILGEIEEGNVLPAEVLLALSQQLTPEHVQLLYQIALQARQDMLLAPDIRIGFEMTLLRMLAFEPVVSGAAVSQDNRVHEPNSRQEESSEGLNPQEVLAGLSSARALMAKSRDSEAAAPANMGGQIAEQSARPSQAMNAEPQSGANQGFQSAAPMTPDFPVQQADGYSAPDRVGAASDSPPWDTALDLAQDSIVQAAQPVQATSFSQAQEAQTPAGSDHLAQIRERLKQPLGKPQTVIEQSVSPQGSVQPAVDSLLAQTAEPMTAPQTVWQENEPFTLSEPLSQPVQAEPAAPMATPSAGAFMDVGLAVSNAEQEAVFEVPASEMVENTGPQVSSGSQNNAASAPLQIDYQPLTNENRLPVWLALLEQIQPEGMAAELARQSVLVEYSQQAWSLSVDPQQLFAKTDKAVERLQQSVQSAVGASVELYFIDGMQQSVEYDTPAKYEQRQAETRQQAAEASIQQDPLVAAFKQELGLEVIPSTVAPLVQ